MRYVAVLFALTLAACSDPTGPKPAESTALGVPRPCRMTMSIPAGGVFVDLDLYLPECVTGEDYSRMIAEGWREIAL